MGEKWSAVQSPRSDSPVSILRDDVGYMGRLYVDPSLANRIAACLNYCDGVDIDVLKAGKSPELDLV